MRIEKRSSERGATTVEYVIFAVAIALVLIFTIKFLEEKGKQAFNEVGNTAGQFGTIGN